MATIRGHEVLQGADFLELEKARLRIVDEVFVRDGNLNTSNVRNGRSGRRGRWAMSSGVGTRKREEA